MTALRAQVRQPATGVCVAALLAATLFWAGGGVVARSAPLGGPQLGFWRSLLAAVAYCSIFTAAGGRIRWSTVRTAAPGGACFGLSVAAIFAAYKSTSFVSANVISALQPLLLVPVSARLGGHRIGARGLTLVVGAIGGTVLVTVASTGEGSWTLRGDLLAVLAAVLGCGYALGTKSARRTLGAFEYAAAAMVVSTVATLPGAALLGGGWIWPSTRQLGWAALLVAVGGTGHLLMAWAQRFLPVVTVSTIVLAEIPALAVASVIFFDERLRTLQVAGIVVTMVALTAFVRLEAGRGSDLVVEAPLDP